MEVLLLCQIIGRVMWKSLLRRSLSACDGTTTSTSFRWRALEYSINRGAATFLSSPFCLRKGSTIISDDGARRTARFFDLSCRRRPSKNIVLTQNYRFEDGNLVVKGTIVDTSANFSLTHSLTEDTCVTQKTTSLYGLEKPLHPRTRVRFLTSRSPSLGRSGHER